MCLVWNKSIRIILGCENAQNDQSTQKQVLTTQPSGKKVFMPLLKVGYDW